ncbi:MAG: DSD1 family PLP-dependent enzyme [Betaproteobacteria bacterium]|nr:DSD1 family PLP-dependent enzyme [Betaproteobacteria bacterium]MDH4292680.1 DSD1 family PLP-dependent enzyme [Betaproteobacteria bacterium]MDH5342623.1 DSD1 family PLP-dependent enzyme [Betaproteobacteria bacterium]
MPRIPPAWPGMALADLDTPSLILDLDAFERNLQRLPESLAGRQIMLRPHAKSHKCPQIALRQIALGAVGVCCQKVSEAEAMVEGGVQDVLVANEVVGAAKLRRLAALARQAKIAVCADDAGNVVQLDAAAREFGVTLDVLVEINVGANRCGAEPGEPALKIAQAIATCKNLRYAGLQAYQGGAQHLRKVEERRTAIDAAVAAVERALALIEKAGLPRGKVTGAGTGTYLFEAASRVYDELQVGSYIFMDADYARNDWTESGIPRFEHSLFVWTTVMSRTRADIAIVDAGLKASSVDSGMPRVADSVAEFLKASDEHGVIKVNGAAGLALGDKIKLIPGHCDPTVNLYDYYVCVRGGKVEALWPITARGAVW